MDKKKLNVIRRKTKKTQIVLYDTQRRFDDFISKIKYRKNGNYDDVPHFVISKLGHIYQLYDTNHYSNTFNDPKIDKKQIKMKKKIKEKKVLGRRKKLGRPKLKDGRERVRCKEDNREVLKELPKTDKIIKITTRDVISRIKAKRWRVYTNKEEYIKFINGYIWCVMDLLRVSSSSLNISHDIQINRESKKKCNNVIKKYNNKIKLTKQC